MDPTLDPRWSDLRGGYRVRYDPRPTVTALCADPSSQRLWDELWDNLHHQGDVGDASYAAVPLLVNACGAGPRDWNLYGLIATIEVERHRRRNPPIPEWLVPAYEFSLARAKDLALSDLRSATDRNVLRSAMAVVALAAGDRELGAMLAHIDSSEITEWIERH